MCPVPRVPREVKLCCKAGLPVAGVELSQAPAWCGEQLHGEADGTRVTKLGVSWKIYPYKIGMALRIIDGHTEIDTFTWDGGSPRRDPRLQAGEIFAVTRGASFSGMNRGKRILSLPVCGGVIGENLPLSIFLSKHWIITRMIKAGFREKAQDFGETCSTLSYVAQ